MNYCGRVVLTLMLACTWVSTAVGAEGLGPNGPRPAVYVFRGFVGYWPDAFGMAARMSQRGYCPHLVRSCDVPRVSSELVAQGSGGPVYIIGYSWGAAAAVTLSRDLMEQGVSVDRLVLIECYDYPEIPANVRYCLNIYESRRLDRVQPFRGTPARAADPSSTALIDIDIACAPEWVDVRPNNHFNMADDPRIQDFVAQQFPDLMQLVPGDAAAMGGETLTLPLIRSQAVAAPTQQVFSPAFGAPNSAHYGMPSAPSGVPFNSRYGSYRGPTQNGQINVANAPLGQPFSVPPSFNLTQQPLSSGYRSGYPGQPVALPPASFGPPRSSAYSSYRMPAPR